MAIQKVRQEAYRKRVMPVRAWREDLKQIESRLRDIQDDGKLEIRIENPNVEYVIDGIDDLQGFGEKQIFEIVFRVDGLSLRLGAANYVIVRDATDYKLQAALDWIVRFTRSKGRFKVYQLLYGEIWKSIAWAIVWMLVLIASLTDVLVLSESEVSTPQSIVSMLVGVGLVSAAVFILKPHRSKIVAATRAESPPFWVREKDDLIISLLSLVAGGVLGYWINTIT